METLVEVKPLPSPDFPMEQHEPTKPKQPRLTMKMLHEMIKDLQRENGELVQRIEQLEQQLEELHRIHEEVAATTEMTPDMPATKPPESSGETEIEIVQPAPVFPQPAVLIPRAIRHAPPKKKKSFWARLFA